MGRKPAPRKYGTPLYCAAWPAGEHLYVAGGGGKKSSGIANRQVPRCCITPVPSLCTSAGLGTTASASASSNSLLHPVSGPVAAIVRLTCTCVNEGRQLLTSAAGEFLLSLRLLQHFLAHCGRRVVAAQYHRGALSDAVGDGWTGEDAPLRMAATPSGDVLVLAMGTGGLMRLDVERLPGAPPRLTPALGACAQFSFLLETGSC